MMTSKRLITSFMVSAGLLVGSASAAAQSGTDIYAGDWPDYHGNKESQRYSPLDQINADNVNSLEIAWRFSTANYGPSPESNSTSTPLEIDGILYVTVGATRNVVALDATSGQVLWLWRPQEGARFDKAPRKGSGRGLSYYTHGDEKRIIVVTPGFFLVSLDAKTGIPDPSFGDNGSVDMFDGLRLAEGRDDIDIGSSMPPLVMNDVVVVGPAHRVSMRPPSKENVKGDVRGYSAITGEHLWTFRTIPQRGDVGYETWMNDGAEISGNAGVWAPLSGDAELGLVYLPVESATGDRYGADRPGNNLFANSLVALDIATGERKWHYQIIHHDIWDWDNPSAPILADLPNGKKVIMQVTKQSYVYTFTRKQQRFSQQNTRLRFDARARQVDAFERRVVGNAFGGVCVRNHPGMVTRVHVDRCDASIGRLHDGQAVNSRNANAIGLAKRDVRTLIFLYRQNRECRA